MPQMPASSRSERLANRDLWESCAAPSVSVVWVLWCSLAQDLRLGFAPNSGNPQDPVDDLSLMPTVRGFSKHFSATLTATEVLGLTGVTGRERTENCVHATGIYQCGQRLWGPGSWVLHVGWSKEKFISLRKLMNQFIPFQVFQIKWKVKGHIQILGVHDAIWAHIKNWGCQKTGAHIASLSEFLRARSLSLSDNLDHPLISVE